MCVVSNMGDSFTDKWGRGKPYTQPWQPNPYAPPVTPPSNPVLPPLVTKEDFDKLKRDLEELKKMILLGKKIDEANGNPDCEMAEKIAFLREVAEMVGIDLDDIFHQ